MIEADQPTHPELISIAEKQVTRKDTQSCRERRKFLEMIWVFRNTKWNL